MASLLPPVDQGYLPYFLLYTSLSAIIHSIVCYTVPAPTSMAAFRGPRAPPAQPLLAHVYGVKNVYTGLIRLYAAYQVQNQAVYDLAVVTFVGVLGLYGLERFVYGTVRAREANFPFFTAGLGLAWMVSQRGHYLV